MPVWRSTPLSRLEGVAAMEGPPSAGRMCYRVWLCLPEGMERRGISIAYAPRIELGLGKGPGCEMVETALIGP
ncbi:hypothetical protein KIPB_006243, partial [Kipferlia bialata]|eukprot:g5739.t1